MAKITGTNASDRHHEMVAGDTAQQDTVTGLGGDDIITGIGEDAAGEGASDPFAGGDFGFLFAGAGSDILFGADRFDFDYAADGSDDYYGAVSPDTIAFFFGAEAGAQAAGGFYDDIGIARGPEHAGAQDEDAGAIAEFVAGIDLVDLAGPAAEEHVASGDAEVHYHDHTIAQTGVDRVILSPDDVLFA